MQEESGASQPWLGKWGQQARASVGNSIQDGDQVASPLPTHSPQLDGHVHLDSVHVNACKTELSSVLAFLLNM
ncbi:hypothetical protein RHMOL_Rhmol05G0157800 [Rhododendron molle]|uniref:Uncharacterized protein n=1 Tax=Rhododendron molle TaxID=49168 RepID=A0ACC0NPU3_RHOML|nr:hypothetical protein RHMOL_Rhmol05G0157800 [Rhododendron molle]